MRCIHCGEELKKAEEICPACGVQAFRSEKEKNKAQRRYRIKKRLVMGLTILVIAVLIVTSIQQVFVTIHMEKARDYADAGQYSEAVEYYTKVLKAHPYSGRAQDEVVFALRMGRKTGVFQSRDEMDAIYLELKPYIDYEHEAKIDAIRITF